MYKMKALIFGSFSFSAAFLLHFVIWKFKRPAQQIKALLLIFFGTLFFLLLTFNLSDSISLTENMQIGIFFISLTLAYITTYSALEVDSPSLIMVITIAKKGAAGLEKDIFEEKLSDELLIRPRLRDMIKDNLAYLENDKFVASKLGLLVARAFVFYRSLLKTGKGG